MAEKFVHGGVEAIERGAHAQTAVERDDLDAVESLRINIHRRNPPSRPRAKFPAALTPQYPFVRVRGQLRKSWDKKQERQWAGDFLRKWVTRQKETVGQAGTRIRS